MVRIAAVSEGVGLTATYWLCVVCVCVGDFKKITPTNIYMQYKID